MVLIGRWLCAELEIRASAQPSIADKAGLGVAASDAPVEHHIVIYTHKPNMGRTKAAGKSKKAAAEAPPPAAAAAMAPDDGPSTSYDAKLPDALELQRTRVVCTPDRNLHVSV